MSFDRLGLLRERALTRVDETYGAKITALLGPLATLHMAKRVLATSGQSSLLVPDGEAVLTKVAEQDAALAALDKERRALKQQISEATCVAALTDLLKQQALT